MGEVQEFFILGLLNPDDGGITLRNAGNFFYQPTRGYTSHKTKIFKCAVVTINEI